MLKCNGKTFMNIQEAVQWLLNNNALFFMCNEDYAADTEISLSELVNPSPANPKIGSLVLFADGGIATVTGITDDSFIVGSDFINIRLQKTVTHFSIDDSHLIVHYSDGTSDDLGAIFSGLVDIDGTLTADHAKIFETIEDKDDHKRFIEGDIEEIAQSGVTKTYGRWSLSGTHLMFVYVFTVTNGTYITAINRAKIYLPSWILAKINPLYATNIIDGKTFTLYSPNDYTTQTIGISLTKSGDALNLYGGNVTANADRVCRIQFDLLIDNA